jgi:hypothetical protein
VFGSLDPSEVILDKESKGCHDTQPNDSQHK